MIFVSHTHTDKDFVEKLVNDLNRWHFDLWFSTWEIAPGESIVEKVQNGVTDSDSLIVILSKKACEANWVKKEVNSFLFSMISEKKGNLIPIMIEDCKPALFIRELLQLRVHEEGYETILTKLIFELLKDSNDVVNSNAIDVFRKTNPPITSIKQFVSRLNDEINNPLRINSDYVILNDQRTLKILPNGDVRCIISLDILLCKSKWEIKDWGDTLYDSIEIPTIQNVNYKTNSQIVSSNYDNKSKSLVISWSPEKNIRPGKTYIHKYEFLVRKGFTAPTNYWVHRTYKYPTLWSKVNIICENKIDDIIACRPPFTFELKEPWEFIAYSLRSMDSFKIISKKKSKLRIELSAEDLNHGLLVTFLTSGWKEYHTNEKLNDGSEERRNLFEQLWFIEEKFRNELGWENIRINKPNR